MLSMQVLVCALGQNSREAHTAGLHNQHDDCNDLKIATYAHGYIDFTVCFTT